MIISIKNMLKLLLVILISLTFSGCAINASRIDAHIETYKRKLEKQGRSIVLNLSYKDSFDIALGVFKENNMIIRRKDYQNKIIMTDGDLKNPGFLLNTPTIFFEVINPSETKLKFIGGIPSVWIEKIKEEVKFRENYDKKE